ncbi:hypothetical protein BTM25_06250 [Actinomadura rubteroloni]|uniref:Uncharacterized protein n=1 Tax=Actinomadura rubteroloni TaxID=1926885 RepID=A0A2P4UMF4_9ACTN|nr:hypothetical protein [Actinomadura rubteroloni]POM26231.1 hypothetical protein BTM25_06250 [Actinomadura rubteroloni]
MNPEQIAGDCRNGDCPAAFDTRDGNVAVRGVPLTGIHAGDGELIVSVPAEIIKEAARALGG